MILDEDMRVDTRPTGLPNKCNNITNIGQGVSPKEEEEKNNEGREDSMICKIVVNNVRGLNDASKQTLIEANVEIENWDIICLTETKIREGKELGCWNWILDNYIVIYSNSEHNARGVCVLIKKAWKKYIFNIEKENGLAIKFDIQSAVVCERSRIIVIYNPCDDTQSSDKLADRLTKWCTNKNANKYKNLMVLGDFNEHTKDTKTIIRRIVKDLKMIDVHREFKVKYNSDKILNYTWSNGSRNSIIDYIYINSQLWDKVIDFRNLSAEDFSESDHTMLQITIMGLEMEEKEKEPKETIERIIWDIPTAEEINMFKNATKVAAKQLVESNILELTVDQLDEKLTSIITEARSEKLPHHSNKQRWENIKSWKKGQTG
jgi:exonuclease III